MKHTLNTLEPASVILSCVPVGVIIGIPSCAATSATATLGLEVISPTRATIPQSTNLL